MGIPEVVEFARNFAVMVRTQGPDPKGLKMQRHAFHHYQSGKTTISASGMLVPDSCLGLSIGTHLRDNHDGSTVVVTVGSIVEPFLLPQHRENLIQGIPELIPGAQIDVMIENKMIQGNHINEPDDGTPQWIPSKLLALVDVPASSIALQSLIEASGVSPECGSWEVGWSLALLNNSPKSLTDGLQTQVGRDTRSPLNTYRHFGHSESRRPSTIAMSTVRIAFLIIPPVTTEGLPNINIARSSMRGNLLLAMGSPFGVLSPAHFFNSISVGSVANLCPSSSNSSSLLMADIRCLPGMEGGPVFSEHAHLIGILSRPLRQRAGGAEIQLVIPWEAIALAQGDLLPNGASKTGTMPNKEGINGTGSMFSSSSPDRKRSFSSVDRNQDGNHLALGVEKAMASVALVTIDDGTWASGVVLNKHGLVLTNAHLFEPWRFGKKTVLGGDVTRSDSLPVTFHKLVSIWQEESENQKGRQTLLPNMVRNSDTSLGDEPREYKVGSSYKSYKRIQVRLDSMDPWIWCDARVAYVSKGPLDIALLQLESFPQHVSPIIPDFTCPSPGSKAYVIGHGLFGPRSDLCPSVCSGVVARVVKAQRHLHPIEPGYKETSTKYSPAMLETTAAVHAGGSGGAVVNSDGHMIGLVTSNARHGGGTTIPQLNFSIPCAALELIFKFSEDMQDLSLLQHLDKPNEHLSSVWALMPPLSPKQVPQFLHQPESLQETNREKKGSRFAKFVAERNGEVFLGPNNLVKEGNKSSSERVLSKL